MGSGDRACPAPFMPWDAARVLLHRTDGTFLAINRRRDPTVLCLPGGKVDAGESAAEAAVRELYEETGLRLPIDALRPLFEGWATSDDPADTRRYRVGVFTLPWSAQWSEPVECEEGLRPRWVDGPTFARHCMHPGFDRAVLAAWEACRT